jgi:type I restriction enzyme, S subunit
MFASDWPVGSFESVFLEPLKNGLTRPKRVRGEGIPMVNMGELFAHRRIGNVPMELVPMSDKEKTKYLLHTGDLLFARQSLVLEGAGQCSIVVGESGTRTFEGHLIRCRLDAELAAPSFYFYLFESPQGKSLVRSIVEQVAAAGIRGSDLKRLEIPVPPLPEQRRIAAVLGALDDKIELNRKMNKTLEEMAQAIFKSWFIDFDGHTDLVDSELGPIPRGWEVKEIQRTVDVKGGGTPRTKEPAFWDGGTIHWTTPKDLSGLASPVLLDTARKITVAGLEKISSGLLPKGTLLLSSRAPVRELDGRREEVERLVVPIKARRLSKKQVGRYLEALEHKLAGNPVALRELLLLLHVHHDLTVVALDSHRLRLELCMNPVSITADESEVTDLPLKIPIVLEGKAGKPRVTNDEWAATENELGHPCACGCGGKIKVRPDMRAPTVGIPRFIQGHGPMPTAVHVQELNAEGYISSTQAAKELGIGVTTLRRAESNGMVQPEYRQWGNRHPMRVYKREDLPKLKEQMKEAGFRFRDDESVLTTREMAEALGISMSYLYYLERKGRIPSPPRDHAGKRMWKRRAVRKFKKLLGR